MSWVQTAGGSSQELTSLRPRTEGKFLWLGNEKFFIKGVTYGAFPPNGQGHQFPEFPEVAKDFRLMRKAGINTILTYTVPPLSLLDQAQEQGIKAIVTIPWMEYVCFLDQPGLRKEIRLQVRGIQAGMRFAPSRFNVSGSGIPHPL